MKKRTVIKILSFAFLFVVLFAGLYIKENRENKLLKNELRNDYSRSLSELNSRLNTISLILEKTAYVNDSSQMSSFASELYSEAELAKSALSQLPAGESSLDSVNRFLSQVGNYALSVSKSVITGNSITDIQRQNLSLLSNTAKAVSQALTDIHIELSDYNSFDDVLGDRLEGSLPQGALADSLTELEENITDYPTLIYDGPFSDHILTKKPLMLENEAVVDSGDALKTAKTISGDNTLKADGNENGRIECYRFKSDNATVTVSKKGGHPVFMRKNRTVGNTSFSYEQALIKAKAFMKENGFTNMTDTYYFSDEGVCVINFAYLDGQTICYTDLMKVGVALDNGEIMLYEASGYLFNHTERAFASPVYSAAQAAEKLSPALTVKETAMALIPSDGGSEIRCWEFLCSGNDERDILVYINVQNLFSEQIFILLKTDGGTLVK